MSTAQSLVRRALRSMGVLAGGQQPGGTDAADGLERLQSIVMDLPGFILNGQWREYATSTDATARESQRVTITDGASVTLPTTITWDGCARPPHDLAKVQIVGETDNAGFWIYSATKGAWAKADGLTLSSELPFGPEDDEGLSAQLAVNLGDEYGATATVGPRTLALAQTSVRSFRARFKKYDHRHHHRDEPGWCDYPVA